MIYNEEIEGIHIYVVPIGDDGSRRERESAAVAALVEEAFGQPFEVEHYENGAPYIKGTERYISISHSREVAVLAVSDKPVGVDAEEWRPQLLRVSSRFMTPEEHERYSTPDKILEAWTLKEAAYKLLQPNTPATAIALPLQDCRVVASVHLGPTLITVVCKHDESRSQQ